MQKLWLGAADVADVWLTLNHELYGTTVELKGEVPRLKGNFFLELLVNKFITYYYRNNHLFDHRGQSVGKACTPCIQIAHLTLQTFVVANRYE
jgi:hypothetical protein